MRSVLVYSSQIAIAESMEAVANFLQSDDSRRSSRPVAEAVQDRWGCLLKGANLLFLRSPIKYHRRMESSRHPTAKLSAEEQMVTMVSLRTMLSIYLSFFPPESIPIINANC